jgi:hypothetical protein
MDKTYLKERKELFIGIGMVLFGVAYYLGSLKIKVMGNVAIAADFLPQIYAYIVIILGIIQILINNPKKLFTSKTKDNVQKESKEVEEIDTKNTLFAFLIIFTYVIIMKPVGFIISSIFFLFGMSVVLTPAYKKKNYIGYLIFSIILSFLAYYLFRKLMYLALPIGIFGF